MPQIFRKVRTDDGYYAIVEGDVNVNTTFSISRGLAIPTTGSDKRVGYVVESGLTNAQAIRTLACYTGEKKVVIPAALYYAA